MQNTQKSSSTTAATTCAISNIHDACSKLQKTIKSFKSSQDVFQYMVQQAGQLPSMDAKLKEDRFLVKGCISRSWLYPQCIDGHIYFFMDSEAMISKGMLALLRQIYHGRTPEEILSVDADFWRNLGVASILSMNRRNGISHMLRQVYAYALTFQALQKSEMSNTDSSKSS